MRFNKKNVVVTGTNSGIGKEVALQLVAEGATVFGLDIDKGSSSKFQQYLCDVSDERQVKNVLQKIANNTEVIHHLVNVAGVLTIGKKTEIVNQDINQWNNILQVNMTSVLIMMKTLYPFLKKAVNASIVNISSDQTFKGIKASAPYIVSKAGINSLTHLAALEFLSDRIRVNALALGSVRTNILKSLTQDDHIIKKMIEQTDKDLPYGILEPIDVAHFVCFLLSEESRGITGQVILVDSGKILL